MLTSKEKAIDYLSRREHSEFELKRKLRVKKFSEDDIASTLEDLQKRNYQSDARFAESYVRYRKQAGFGPLRISAELQMRGVLESLIKESINAYADEWGLELRNTFQKKFSTIGVTLKEKEKQFRFLLSRGFSAEDIRDFLF